MSKDIKTKNWGAGPIVVPQGTIEMRPTELHMLDEGSLLNEASLAFVCTIPGSYYAVLAQISVAMWNEALGELGYQITKKEDT